MRKLTVRETAELLAVPIRTVQHWAKTGRLPAEQLPGPNGAYLIDRADVEALCATRGAVRPAS